MKLYLSYYFQNGKGFYSILSTSMELYREIEAVEVQEIDKRITKLTPGRYNRLRSTRYFKDRTYKLYNYRVK